MPENYKGQTIEALNENAQFKTPINGSEREPDDAYRMVMQLLEWSKSKRTDREANWQKYRRFYNGQQWVKKPPAFRAAPNMNIIRSTVETVLPILTDTYPGFDCMAKNPQDYQFSDTMSKAIRDWWSRRGMDHIVALGLKDALIVDCGIMKVIWNECLEAGLGDIDVSVVDIENLWVSPGCTDFDDADWVIEKMFKSVGQLKRQFPEKAELIKAQGSSMSKDVSPKFGGEIQMVSPVDRKSPLSDMKNTSGTNIDDYQQVEVYECWLRATAVQEYELNKDTDAKPQENEPAGREYIRIITVLPGQKLVLQDKESPFNDGRMPYVRFIDNLCPREFYGQGEVEPLIEVQVLINKASAVIYDYMNTMTNPVWIIDNESGVKPDRLTNLMGLVIRKKQNTEVRRDSAPSLPPQLFQIYQMLQALADQQSGINDVTQGRKPVGITAAEALQTMQEAAQTRIRLKQRNMEVSLAQLGMLVISRMMQYYDTPRVVRMTTYDAVWPKYFEFYIENLPDGMYQLNQREHQLDENGKVSQTKDWQKIGEPTLGLFSVDVRGGTSLPFLRQQRGDMALKLFQGGLIDQEEVLNVLDWPRKEEVLKRMVAAKQQAQQPPAGGQQQQTGLSQAAQGVVRSSIL